MTARANLERLTAEHARLAMMAADFERISAEVEGLVPPRAIHATDPHGFDAIFVGDACARVLHFGVPAATDRAVRAWRAAQRERRGLTFAHATAAVDARRILARVRALMGAYA